MAENLKVGDVVQLKSGSPDMTIQEVGEFAGDGYVSARCQWFDSSGLKAGKFPLESLVRISE